MNQLPDELLGDIFGWLDPGEHVFQPLYILQKYRTNGHPLGGIVNYTLHIDSCIRGTNCTFY